jgi:capsular polysaccharide biosynthesis protein
MHGYGKTFRKRWPLYLLLPLIFAVAVGYLSLEKKSYQSTATLWVDYSPSEQSSLNLTTTSGETAQPSTVEQGTLTELLSTSAFDDAVAAQAGVTPAARNAIADALDTTVTSAVPGPQILSVTYTGPSALQAKQIASSVVDQLQVWTSKLEKNFDGAATKYTQSLYDGASKAVASAKAAVNTYHFTHRGATTQNDQTYASLVSALAVATSSLASERSALNQDAAQSQNKNSAATISVMDAASLPTAPHKKIKTLAVKIIGAGIAGGLVSFLLVMLFTPGGSGREIDELYSGELMEQPRGPRPTSPATSWTVGISSGAVAGGRALSAGSDSAGDQADGPDPSGGTGPHIRVVLGDGQRQAGA